MGLLQQLGNIMENYEERSDCRLCRSSNIEIAIPFEATPIGDEYLKESDKKKQDYFPLNVSFCNDCGFVQLQNIVSPKEIYENYIYETSASLGLVEHFQKYAALVKNKINLEEKSFVVELGSNDGTFLKAWKDLGMSVLGFEPAINICKKSNKRGVETLNKFFNYDEAKSISSSHGKADLIVANNVLANIDDLEGIAKAIKELLSENGTFIFESGYMIDTFEGKVIDNVYHEHLSYFSVLPVIPFFERHGLDIYDVEHIKTKGGSVRCYIQHKEATRPISDSVLSIAKQEEELGYKNSKPLTDLSSECLSLKKELEELLSKAKAEGKKIAGYGASVGVTTLLHYFGLDSYLECLYDDNPIRDGLLSPGHHLKVKSSEMIYEDKPDLIVLLAWRYKDPIMKRHQKFIEQGGAFVLPLPNIKVYS